ncbi:Protein PTST homolog 2, chloroplastic [Linum grandiflorum]
MPEPTMLPVTTVDTHLFIPPGLSFQTLPASIFTVRYRTELRRRGIVSLRCAALLKEEAPPLLGFLDVRKRNVREFGAGKFVRRCGHDLGSEGGDCSALEDEVLEFMKSSEEPEVFPSKKQLIDAGRRDLVEGIVRKGGWMASGWDSESDESEGEDLLDWEIETESTDLLSEVESDQGESQEVFSSASSSGRSLETAAEDDSGVEGMLNRLKRQRNVSLGFELPQSGEGTHPAYQESSATSKSSTVADIERNGEPASVNPDNGKNSHFSQFTGADVLENSLKPDDWRTWRAEKAASSLDNFEAGEIISEASRSEALQKVEGCSGTENGKKIDIFEAGLGPIRIRLRQMESELSTILNVLKSASTGDVSHKDSESSCDDQACESSCDDQASDSSCNDELVKLYDDLEFCETEIMRQKDKLRSTRAKLAIEEGRMALRTIDAQRVVEEKRKRGSSGYKALQLLSNAYLVWTNKATEVLVTGSFDGWATKRKMKKSKKTGVFSLYMKLYPGKYEIKFIVDGEWKVDLLRPTVEYKGYVNNVLIVH